MTESASFPASLDEAFIRLTPAAEAKLAELLAESDAEIEAVRVYVAGGGCSGMNYGMTFTDSRTDFDAVLEREGVRIYIDAVALSYLKGLEIDFVEHPGGAAFVFNNVFAATGGSGSCGGCGSAGGGCA
ncbi:MAG TPA: iron-sulfur cluster assembly accessory protein [Thiotrichales bacterium]|nr:iron-sulfur cluster assembly accessory protein [Thiotrichales bacterium]